MSAGVLILRPMPGAKASAARARALGLEAVTAPLFRLRALSWTPPDPESVDAVLLTSANAARLAGDGLRPFFGLSLFAVGEATAAAAAGFSRVHVGPGGGAALVEQVARAGLSRVLHPCGRDHVPLRHPRLAITRRPVYAAEEVDALPAAARAALVGGAVALLHSPRAASLFARLVDEAGLARGRMAIAAISAAAAAAAGPGWKSIAAAPRPRDAPLLELAARLCNKGAAG